MVYWLMVCLLLICIAGLRYRLGTDTTVYMQDYKTLHPISQLHLADFSNSRYQPGYIILTSLAKQISPDFTLFQFMHSLIFNSVVFYFIYKYSRNRFFALLIYFFYLYFIMAFQQLREALAVSVFLLAWPFFRDRKWIWWYLAAILAFNFHVSAGMMFFLPLIALPGIRELFKFGKRTIFVCLGIAVVGFVIQKLFFSYLEILALTDNLTERIQTYGESELGTSTFNFRGVIVFIIQYALYPFVILFLKYKERDQETEQTKKWNVFVLMSIYVTIFTLFVAIFGRYNNYFFPFVIVFMSNFIFKPFYVNRKKIRLTFVYWMFFFLPMFTIHTYNNYFIGLNRAKTYKAYMFYYPYNSVLDKGKDETREKAMRYMRRLY